MKKQAVGSLNISKHHRYHNPTDVFPQFLLQFSKISPFFAPTSSNVDEYCLVFMQCRKDKEDIQEKKVGSDGLEDFTLQENGRKANCIGLLSSFTNF